MSELHIASESAIDISKSWYFGNNRAKNLRLVAPSWNAPFFLTANYSYAENYSDYGVYKIELASQSELKILDFNNKAEVQKLKWPKVLVDKILAGKNDLNSIASDLYLLAAGETSKLMYIQPDDEWLDAALHFYEKSEGIFKLADKSTVWGDDAEFPDHRIVLQMWKDIYDAGFSGFTHKEFENEVLALFDLKCISKVSVRPISKTELDESLQRLQFMRDVPEDKFKQIISKSDVTNMHFNMDQFSKLYGQDYTWCMLLDGASECVAAAALLRDFGPVSGMTYVNELQSLKSGAGYGKCMLLKLQDAYPLVWLIADPSVKSSKLLKFYRDPLFKFAEHVLPADDSKYGVDTHAFAPEIRMHPSQWTSWLKQYFGNDQAVASLAESDNGIAPSLKKLIGEVVASYASLFGIDLSYMKFTTSPQPVYTSGEPCFEFSQDECAGDWTELGWIRLNPDMQSVMDRYGIECRSDEDIENFAKIIVAHKLGHEVWNKIADGQFKKTILDRAEQASFTTPYLRTVDARKIDEETFCEWLAHLVVPQKKQIMFPEDDIQALQGQEHVVTHRVLDDIDKFNEGDIAVSPWGIEYRVSSKALVDNVMQSPCADSLTSAQMNYLDQFSEIAVIELDAVYAPPYTLEQIKDHYPEDICKRLAADPVHSWRAKTGIELIHREPTEDELDRIWMNWQLMPQHMKDISDQKSLEMFGCTNADHYSQLKACNVVNENKQAYLKKNIAEPDAKDVVEKFWQMRSKLNAPQNDIDWWIKKPFAELKSFVQSYQPAPNKRQRRDAEICRNAFDNGAKLLGQRDGYEIWYVPTYDAMVNLGRFYKGRSAKWCVASDDPSFWFDMHDNDEFVLLVREHPKNDEYDKIAVQMQNQGRHFDLDSIVPWDIENNDDTFDLRAVSNPDGLLKHAWMLFKQNGETREQYFG